MIDIKRILADPDGIKAKLAKRGYDADADGVPDGKKL